MNADDLTGKRCRPCEGGVSPLSGEEVAEYLVRLEGWSLVDDGIVREFRFRNYFRTIAFVNAVAWIAHGENHHPDLEVSYRSCRVRYRTHAIGGLSENDFISAAKVDALMEGREE